MQNIKEEISNNLQELLKIKSYTKEETEFGLIITQRLMDMGLLPHIDQKGNVYALHDSGKERTVILNAHMDTVPGEVPVEEKNGRIYGRGAADMKGAITGILLALKSLKDRDTWCNIEVHFVVQEEGEGPSGTDSLVKKRKDADFAIVTEPTSLGVYIGQIGRTTISVKIYGKAGHAGTPEKTDNAIYRAAKAIENIKRIEPKTHEVLGPGLINITKIQGGEWSNIIPDRCTLTIDRRLTLGENSEDVIDEIKNSLTGLDFNVYLKTGRIYSTPFLISEESESIKRLKKAAEKFIKSRTGVMRATTDASYYNNAGIPAVIFGPGNIEDAHSEQEMIELDQIENFVKILVDFLEEK